MKMTFSEMNTRPRKSLVANPLACTGCRTCESVCSLIKTKQMDLDRARLHVDRDPFEGRFVQKICYHCSIPYCLNACPVDAIRISEKDGTVFIDNEKCSGCGECREACPYGMIIYDQEQKKAFKCDFCGGNPQCVKMCPMNALGIAIFASKEPK